MRLRSILREGWLPKGTADLQEFIPGGITPDPLSLEYLLIVVELRKRQYLIEIEKLRRTSWWQIPRRIVKVYRAKRVHRATSELLAAEMARILAADPNRHS